MAGKMFEVRAIKVDVKKEMLKPARVRARILNAEKEVAKKILEDLYKTVEYWKHKVVFDKRMHYAAGNIYLEVGPVASVRGSRIWTYVDQGTSTIPFTFNENYKQKTSYDPSKVPGGSIGNNYAGDKYNLPRYKIKQWKLVPSPPGIRPRGWSTLIQMSYEEVFGLMIQDAIDQGME